MQRDIDTPAVDSDSELEYVAVVKEIMKAEDEFLKEQESDPASKEVLG
jgi:hypothetical protein